MEQPQVIQGAVSELKPPLIHIRVFHPDKLEQYLKQTPYPLSPKKALLEILSEPVAFTIANNRIITQIHQLRFNICKFTLNGNSVIDVQKAMPLHEFYTKRDKIKKLYRAKETLRALNKNS